MSTNDAASHDASPTLQVRVRYFASLREQRGVEDELVEFPVGFTAAQAYSRLFPPGPQGQLPVMYAIDQSYVSADTPLRDGAELAFIPPLGGG